MQRMEPAPVRTTGRWEIFSALRYRNFRLYWFGQLCSVFSQSMEWIAMGWLVLEITNSPLSLGLTGLAQALPNLSLALVGGAIADRMDRRRVLIFTQIAVGLVYATIGALAFTGLAQLWHIVALSFLLGAVRVFDQPARQALLPHLVPRDDISNAVAMGSLAWQFPRLIGPALAGLLIAHLAVSSAFFTIALGAGACALLFSLIRVDQDAIKGGTGSLLRNVIEGLTFIVHHQLFLALMGMTFFNSLFGMSYQILMPVFARDILQAGPQGYGYLNAVAGVGGLCGSLAAAYLAGSRRKGLQALVGSAAFGLMLIGFGASSWFTLSLGFMFGMSLANQMYMTTITAALQLNVPDELRGRVMGVWGLTWSLVPLGGTITGTVAEYAGAPAAVMLGGGLVFLLAATIAAGLPRVRSLA
jgi:MFS family permease